jgi:hypothetical protein
MESSNKQQQSILQIMGEESSVQLFLQKDLYKLRQTAQGLTLLSRSNSYPSGRRIDLKLTIMS